jgi:hypothetical protein
MSDATWPDDMYRVSCVSPLFLENSPVMVFNVGPPSSLGESSRNDSLGVAAKVHRQQAMWKMEMNDQNLIDEIVLCSRHISGSIMSRPEISPAVAQLDQLRKLEASFHCARKAFQTVDLSITQGANASDMADYLEPYHFHRLSPPAGFIARVRNLLEARDKPISWTFQIHKVDHRKFKSSFHVTLARLTATEG